MEINKEGIFQVFSGGILHLQLALAITWALYPIYRRLMAISETCDMEGWGETGEALSSGGYFGNEALDKVSTFTTQLSYLSSVTFNSKQ